MQQFVGQARFLCLRFDHTFTHNVSTPHLFANYLNTFFVQNHLLRFSTNTSRNWALLVLLLFPSFGWGQVKFINSTQSASVAVTGTAAKPTAQPTTQPTVTATSPTTTTVLLTLSGGDGAKRLVVVRPVGDAAVAPADGSTYTAHPAYGTTTGTNPTTGTNNFVVVADGSTTSVTITGLAASTAYAVEAYAYNDASTSEEYLTATPGTATFTTVALPITYTWTPGLDNNWTTATNWVPVRSSPATTDILVFDGAVPSATTVNVDFPLAGETVGQLQFTNNITVTLITDATRTLTIDGNAAGDDFLVGKGSVVTIGTLAAPAALVLSLTALETGSIGGSLVFDGSSAAAFGQHSLQAAAANAVQFLSGSTFRTTAFYDGGASISPFGAATGNANTVVFRNGSRYEQFGGSNPFGLAAPATAVTFESGSRFVFAQAANAPALSGRTYGTLEYNTTSTDVGNSTDTGLLTVLGNLIITNGTVGLDLTAAGISLKGDVLVNGGSLAFNPSGTGTGGVVQFNGTSAQVIGGSAASALTFGTNSSATINNLAGVTLQRPITLQNGFTLTSGTLTTDATNLLTLGADATVSGGSTTSYINGPLARATPAGIASATDYVFPIGKGTAYRPLTLTIMSQTSTTTYSAAQKEGVPTDQVLNSDVKRVSRIRSFSVTPDVQPTGFSGTVTLSFAADDRVTDPAAASFIIAKSDGSGWGNIGRSAYTGTANAGAFVAGTLTSAPFTSFSDFALASTDASITTNPLPVQLSSFSARRQATNAVAVRWTTASEKNSAYFEVQRSFDARVFVTVAKLLAQGTSTSSRATAYVTTDEQAPAGPLYYRLHQVDTDGKAAYSPVVTIAGDQADVVLYPNPAQTTLYLATAAATAYRVLNPLGQVLLQGTTAAGPATIAVGQLAPGLYHLELQTSTGRAMRKFVKE